MATISMVDLVNICEYGYKNTSGPAVMIKRIKVTENFKFQFGSINRSNKATIACNIPLIKRQR